MLPAGGELLPVSGENDRPARFPNRIAVDRPIPLDAPVTITTAIPRAFSRKRRRPEWDGAVSGRTYRLLWYASTIELGMRPRSETS
jgi:hypothetical protein